MVFSRYNMISWSKNYNFGAIWKPVTYVSLSLLCTPVHLGNNKGPQNIYQDVKIDYIKAHRPGWPCFSTLVSIFLEMQLVSYV